MDAALVELQGLERALEGRLEQVRGMMALLRGAGPLLLEGPAEHAGPSSGVATGAVGTGAGGTDCPSFEVVPRELPARCGECGVGIDALAPARMDWDNQRVLCVECARRLERDRDAGGEERDAAGASENRGGRGGRDGRTAVESRGDEGKGRIKHRTREAIRCTVCGERKGVTAFLRGCEVCRVCQKRAGDGIRERGIRGALEARAASKMDDGQDGGASFKKDHGEDGRATSKRGQGEDGRGTSGKGARKGVVQKGLRLVAEPERTPQRPAGRLTATGNFRMTVELFKEWKKGKTERLYSMIRRWYGERGDYAWIRLFNPAGGLEETVRAEEVWE